MAALFSPQTCAAAPSRHWQLQAACRQLPTELFFPVGNGARARAQARVAKDVCSACDVRSQCLAFALAANLRHGVFGGLGEEERREVRRRERLRSAARGGPGSARL